MKTELEQKLNAHIRLAAENMLEGELDGNLMSRYLYGGMEDVLKLLLPHLKAAGLLPANYTVPSSRDVRLNPECCLPGAGPTVLRRCAESRRTLRRLRENRKRGISCNRRRNNTGASGNVRLYLPARSAKSRNKYENYNIALLMLPHVFLKHTTRIR